MSFEGGGEREGRQFRQAPLAGDWLNAIRSISEMCRLL